MTWQLEACRAQLDALKPRAARVTSLELELSDLQHLKGAWQKVREASGSDAALLDSPVRGCDAVPLWCIVPVYTLSSLFVRSSTH